VTLQHCLLGADYVEEIHDRLIAIIWPGTDPVHAEESRSRDLIESAVGRPFQTAFGSEIYPGIPEKGAALFHSLISNHPFHNGNKRTAVIALDHFYLANDHFLLISNDEMYKLAEETASYRERLISHEASMQEILEGIKEKVVSFDAILLESTNANDARYATIHQRLVEIRDALRADTKNKLL
jgi:death-on-curing family protein